MLSSHLFENTPDRHAAAVAGTPERRNAGTPERRNAGTHYRPIALPWLAAVVCMVAFVLMSAQTRAALTCTPVSTNVINYNTSINVHDVDAEMPLEPVGRWLQQLIVFTCTASAPWNNRYAVAFVPTAHTAPITWTGTSAIRDSGGALRVFTTPQLEALGLGYMLYWHTTSQPGTSQLSPGRDLVNPNQITPSVFLPRTETSFGVGASVWMHYVKIGPLAGYETAHAFNPAPVPLASFFVTDLDNPPQPPASAVQNISIPVPALTLTRRTCTTPSPTYNLGNANFISDFPTIGSTGPELEFTLTFNCPQGYNFVGISFVPVNGAANETLHPGVMNSNLDGVGVQLLTRLPKVARPGNHTTLAPDWQPVEFNRAYYLRQYLRPDPGNPANRSDYSETFRARYYRTGNTTGTGGQMKAAVWVHMVYK